MERAARAVEAHHPWMPRAGPEPCSWEMSRRPQWTPPAGARASNPSAAPRADSLTPQAGAHKSSQATAPPVDPLAPLARAHANHQGVAPPAGHPFPLTSHSLQESAAIRQLQDQMSTLLSVIYF
jgi:hypothetical protein